MDIKQDLIPVTNRNRPQTRINPKYITVHETANRNRGADANAHANYVSHPETGVSWHYTVDDKQIIQHLPNNEIGWHAGTNGNRNSVGIELCVNSDGDFEKTKANAQWLIRKLMYDLSIPIAGVVTHQFWTGKNCPTTLIPIFEKFKKGVVQVAPARIEANVVYEGKKVTAFVENGVTYVPVRELSEMIGLKVGWEQSTRTVKLTK